MGPVNTNVTTLPPRSAPITPMLHNKILEQVLQYPTRTVKIILTYLPEYEKNYKITIR
jgi:hypothetical protein